MASERGMQTKADFNSRNWENSEFPVLCGICIGEAPFIRMIKDVYGATCKMCDRPYTVFKWRPGRGESYKRTEVCIYSLTLRKNLRFLTRFAKLVRRSRTSVKRVF